MQPAFFFTALTVPVLLAQQSSPSLRAEAAQMASEATQRILEQGKPGAPVQTSILSLPASTVFATVDGLPVTAGELQIMLRSIPPQVQQQALQDPQMLLRRLGLMRRLAAEADRNRLAEQSPYKEMLAAQRQQTLAQAQVDFQFTNGIALGTDEVKIYYDNNREKYQQARVKAIYIPFGTAQPGADAQLPKPLTEEEARTKAQDIAKQAREGGDFVKLVREYSKDAKSVDKDGDFGAIGRSGPSPEPIKMAVLAAKPGQITDPVRQPNGFYIFRIEESSVAPFHQVQGKIQSELKDLKFSQWLQALEGSIQVKIEVGTSVSGTISSNPSVPVK